VAAVTLPNWQEVEDHLYAFTVEAIGRFAAEHPDEICSFFAYDVDLPFFLLSLDTPTNAFKEARQTEHETVEERARRLAHPLAWQSAEYLSSYPPILDYSYNVGAFAYHDFTQVKLDALEDLEFEPDYPRDERFNDYTEGSTRIMLWRIVERLIADDAMSQLRLASPFRLGYQLHDRPLTVLRILNWPNPE
jgi:hypothetical protein